MLFYDIISFAKHYNLRGNNMIAVICLDDKNGYLFNNRRQSQDRIIRAKLVEMASGTKLWMNAYTQRQFENEMSLVISVDEEFAEKAGIGEYCFFENVSPADYLDRAEEIIVVKWNRVYPSDRKFDIKSTSYTMEDSEDIQGSSHEKITIERYRK